MSVTLAAFASEFVKIAEAQKHEQKPGYLRAVVAGLPVVTAQALSDIPEGAIERGTENLIRRAGSLKAHGSASHLGGLRFASRIGAGAITTPLFISGMQDISAAKSKKDENRGLSKLLAAGAVYTGFRSGIESKFDPAVSHLPSAQKFKRVIGPKALMGIGGAALTGLTVGKSLQDKGKKESFSNEYLKPAAIGAVLAGGKGAVEGGLEHGFKNLAHSPKARWAVGARVGGKAVAGAAATLFLSRLMKKVLGKEKKASAPPVSAPPSAAELNTSVSAWARTATPEQLSKFYEELKVRGAERSPANRAAFYAVHDELTSRGAKLPPLTSRGDVDERIKVAPLADASLLLGIAAAPTVAWLALQSIPESVRDRALVDALDRTYIQGKIERLVDAPRGFGTASAAPPIIRASPDVGSVELAHEIGHATAGKLRQATTLTHLAGQAQTLGAVASILLPTLIVGTAGDGTYATKEELEAKAKAAGAIGVVSGALQLPGLAEEAVASVKGLKYLSSVGASKSELAVSAAKLLPAYGSYLVPATIPFIAASLLRRKAEKKVNE